MLRRGKYTVVVVLIRAASRGSPGTEKLWVSVILKFLDDLYPPLRVFDVSPVSVGDPVARTSAELAPISASPPADSSLHRNAEQT